MLSSTTLCALALTALQSAGGGPVADPAAGRLLDRAREALNALESLHFSGSYLRTYVLEGLVSRVDGDAWLQRTPDGLRLRVCAEILLRQGTPRLHADLVLDEQGWHFFDHLGRFVSSGNQPHLAGRASLLARDFVAWFIDGLPAPHGELPVSPEAAAATRSRRGVNENETLLVLRSEDGNSQTTWILDATDALPLGFERRVELARGETLTERLTIETLWRDSGRQSAGVFDVDAPEDYPTLPAITSSPRQPLRLRQPREIRVTSLAQSLEPLRQRFQASPARTRVIALFAPT